MKRPAEGKGGPASEAVKQMASEMHRRWPRFTHALPLFLSLPPSLALLRLHTISCSFSLVFLLFLPQYVGISLSTSGNIRFSPLDICGVFFLSSFFLSLSLSLPD